MTHAEIKAAFMDEYPVMFNGVRYRRVSALIYRKNPMGTGLVMQAELLDQNYRAVVMEMNGSDFYRNAAQLKREEKMLREVKADGTGEKAASPAEE